jgi:hypothetical protein
LQPPEFARLLADARELTRRSRAPGPSAVGAYRELCSLLLRLTVVRDQSSVVIIGGPRREVRLLTGFGAAPLLLTDGRFLRMSVQLSASPGVGGPFRVTKASYQYQQDAAGDDWVFRYDYLREPAGSPHPAAHLQVRGTLAARATLAPGRQLERVHFVTGRVSLEAVIRVLVEQFGVPARSPAATWRPVLAETERQFLEDAWQPLSGPAS